MTTELLVRELQMSSWGWIADNVRKECTPDAPRATLAEIADYYESAHLMAPVKMIREHIAREDAEARWQEGVSAGMSSSEAAVYAEEAQYTQQKV